MTAGVQVIGAGGRQPRKLVAGKAARVTSALRGVRILRKAERKGAATSPPAFRSFCALFLPCRLQLLLASRITFHVPLCLLSPVLVGPDLAWVTWRGVARVGVSFGTASSRLRRPG